MEVLDQIAGVLGEQIITGEKYGRLLKEIVSGEDVSDIPQSMDSITFGTADRIRQSAPRAVFLLGAVQGEFPLISVRKRCVQRRLRSAARSLHSSCPFPMCSKTACYRKSTSPTPRCAALRRSCILRIPSV